MFQPFTPSPSSPLCQVISSFLSLQFLYYILLFSTGWRGIKLLCCYFDASPDIALPNFLVSKVPDCQPWASSHSCIPRSPGLWDCADVSKSVQPKGAGLKRTGAGMQLVVKIQPVHILGDCGLGSFQAGPVGRKQSEPFSLTSSERGPVCVSCSLLETNPQGFAVLQGQYELEC